MRETSPATATTAEQPTDTDLELVARLLAAIAADPLSVGELLVVGVVEARKAGHAAGLAEGRQLGVEEAADDAHASGYREGVGRCGRSLPTLDDYTPGTVCTLPAGHEGWHRSDNGAEWGMHS